MNTYCNVVFEICMISAFENLSFSHAKFNLQQHLSKNKMIWHFLSLEQIWVKAFGFGSSFLEKIIVHLNRISVVDKDFSIMLSGRLCN